MKFDINRLDPCAPVETKEAFKWRFLLSLPSSFQDAASQSKVSAAVLHVRSEVSMTLLEKILFWKAPRLHNLPLQAKWAAEALTEQGYIWSVGWYQNYATGVRHPALWVEFPWGHYNADQMAVFMNPVRVPRREFVSGTTNISRGSHLKLVWNRDAQI